MSSEHVSVYRLEDAAGVGPYNTRMCNPDLDYTLDEMHHQHASCSTHPPMVADVAFDRHHRVREYLCGCSSLEQLSEWFGEFLQPLIAAGFRVVRYELPPSDVLYGRWQAAFVPDSVIDITDFTEAAAIRANEKNQS